MPVSKQDKLHGAFGHSMRLAMSHASQGRPADAAKVLREATVKFPKLPDAHLNLGNFLAEYGRLDEAQACYEKLLVLQPDHPIGHFNMGNLHRIAGRWDAAEKSFRRALQLTPDDADTHTNLGLVYAQLQQLDNAEACYRRALALSPGHLQAQNNLGNVLRAHNRLEEAIACYEKVLAAAPTHIDALVNFSTIRIAQKRYDDAQTLCEKVIRLDAGNVESRYNLAQIMSIQDRHEEAIAWHREVVKISPRFIQSYAEMAAIRSAQHQADDAIALARKALTIDPNYAHAHWTLSLALLLAGQYEEGWREHEWRWRWTDYTARWRNYAQPQWQGEDISGKTILLYPEQGLGTMMQLARYVPLVHARGAKVVLEAPPELARLMRASFGTPAEIVAPEAALPPFDLHCPLMSLPLAFGTTLDSLPQNGPYLSAPPDLIAKWQARLAASGAGLRVGLSWAGNPKQGNDHNRSLALHVLGKLGGVPNVQFYGLQKGAAAEQAIPPGLDMVQLGDALEDFADTAALMMNLDLIISVDTAVSHLAGALGRKSWTMLTHCADWRYLLNRSDSPWYPAMRLYRQRTLGDWDDVVTQVRADLQRASEEHATSGATRAPGKT